MKDNERLSNPLDYIINCCEQGLIPQSFDISNAKDQLKKLRDNKYTNVAWARINDRGDLYDPRLLNNPCIDQETVVPLYLNNEEYKIFAERLKKRLTD